MRVPVPHVPHQLPAGGEAGLAVFTPVGLGAGVSVDVVLQTGQSLEPSLTHRTLVRSLLTVGLHVPGEEISLGSGVVAVVTHVNTPHPH